MVDVSTDVVLLVTVSIWIVRDKNKKDMGSEVLSVTKNLLSDDPQPLIFIYIYCCKPQGTVKTKHNERRR